MDPSTTDSNETDLNAALAQFADETATQEQRQHQAARIPDTKTKKITLWLMMHSGGSIKDEAQANYVLIGMVVIAIIVSLVLFFHHSQGAVIQAPAGSRVVYPENGPPRLQ